MRSRSNWAARIATWSSSLALLGLLALTGGALAVRLEAGYSASSAPWRVWILTVLLILVLVCAFLAVIFSAIGLRRSFRLGALGSSLGSLLIGLFVLFTTLMWLAGIFISTPR